MNALASKKIFVGNGKTSIKETINKDLKIGVSEQKDIKN